MIFYKLKQNLSQQNDKKATWEEVAEHYQIPFFQNKTSKQISMLLSQWKTRGLPSHIQLWLIKNDFEL